MMRHEEHAGLQEQGSKALWNMMSIDEYDHTRDKVSEVGGVETVVKGLVRHQEHAGVQQEGCRFLWNFVTSEVNKVAVREAGGIEAVVRGMVRHQEHAGVQKPGDQILQTDRCACSRE